VAGETWGQRIEFSETAGRGPVEGAWQAFAAPSWSVLLDRVAPGPLDLRIRCTGRGLRKVEVDRDRLVAAWRERRVLSLRVPRARRQGSLTLVGPSGRPAPHALVALAPASGPGGIWATTIVADEGGRVPLVDLEDGVPYVACIRELNGPGASHGPWLPTGDLVVRLHPPRRLRVRALWEPGRPARGVQVRAQTQPYGLLPTVPAITDASGWATFPSVVPEAYRFVAWGRDPLVTASRPFVAMTHERVVDGRDLRGDDEIVMEPR